MEIQHRWKTQILIQFLSNKKMTTKREKRRRKGRRRRSRKGRGKGKGKLETEKKKGIFIFLILLAREATWPPHCHFSSAFQVLYGNLLGGVLSVLET